MQKIKYIGFYDTAENEHEKRNYILAATNKMDYIAAAIKKGGYQVNFISPSWTYNKKFYRGKVLQIDENIILKLGPTIPWVRNLKLISVIISNLWLLLYLLISARRDEEIIAYHSNWSLIPIYIAKKIKKFKLILEVEEIYSHVKNYARPILNIEEKFFQEADGYIFSTELLEKRVNRENKPSTIIYGTYQVEPDFSNIFSDDKIHIVYAGTLDPRKGSLTAVKAALYLNDKYHIHILGFGSQDDLDNLSKCIESTLKKTDCSVSYDGILRGEKYIEFLQSCDIGLSPQSPNSEFNETSFPSKILSYLANGLRVVTIKIKSIEESKVSKLLKFYEVDDPAVLAEAIENVELNEYYDSKNEIKKLSLEFQNEILGMLEKGR